MKDKTLFKKAYIAVSLLVFSLAVTYIDAVVQPEYFSKIPIKILFFLALPMLFFAIHRDEFAEFRSLFKFKKEGLLRSFVLGILIYAVIFGGYLLTRNIIDYSGVTANLTSEMGITADNFVYVSLYISLMNSFLEEFFFRGFGFITLKKYFNIKFAYIFSPILFAVYHVGMLLGMFSAPMLLLILLGLIIGGLIFNFLNDKFGNIYPSWFVHMFANFAINTIGFMLFGIYP
ncbi:MAG: CPBP family intramembrane metalloprotease [Clostridia bacterium]|nr:CPBP family intramembrane metalloprotease [Clostridia bacterium]